MLGLSALSLEDKSVLAQELLRKNGSAKWLVKFLITLLDHANPNLRYFACGCMGSTRSRRAYKAVRQVFANPESDVRLRRMAGNALGFLSEVGNSKDVIRLLSAITDEDLLIAGVNALGYYRDRRAEKYLLRVIRDRSASPNVRAYAAESLGLHSRRAVKGLIKTIADGPLEARFFSARALGWIGDRRAIPALRKMAATEIEVLDWQPDGGSLSSEATIAIESILAKKHKR